MLESVQSLFVSDITDDQQCFATAMALVCKDLTVYVISCEVASITSVMNCRYYIVYIKLWEDD